MKKIFFAFCLNIIMLSHTFGQASLDANGNSITISQNQNLFQPLAPSMLSIAPYDSVRILSEINQPSDADAYPWISADALRIYYTKSTAGVYGYYVTSRPDTSSPFSTPQLLDPIFPASSASVSCWLSPDELDFYFISSGSLCYSHRNTITSPFNPYSLINLVNGPQASFGFSLDSAQNELFTRGFTQISRYLRTSLSSFTYVGDIPLQPGLIPGPGHLSKDGLTLFYTNTNTNNMLIYAATRPDTSTAFGIGQIVPGINDTTIFNGQASASANLDWVAFIRANTNSWSADDLFIAHKGSTPTPVFETAIQNRIKVYPNPFMDQLNVSLYQQTQSSCSISLLNIFGKEVLYQEVQSQNVTLNTKNIAEGIYFITINKNGVPYTQKVIKL